MMPLCCSAIVLLCCVVADTLDTSGVARHIQVKTTMAGGKAVDVKVSLKLMEKPSGCILWIVVTPELYLQSYLVRR